MALNNYNIQNDFDTFGIYCSLSSSLKMVQGIARREQRSGIEWLEAISLLPAARTDNGEN